MPRIDVVDLSHWQTVSSFSALAGSGVVAVIHKATEGTGYVDPTYWDRVAPAQDAGLLWSAYHFMKHGNVAAQMDHFLVNAALPPGSRWMLDYEDPACTLDDLEEACGTLSMLDPTAQIGIYSGHLLKEQVGSTRYDWLAEYPLWLAQYTTGTPSWPKQIWPYYSLWQFTDQGTVPGVGPPTDLNHFNGSREACAKWFGQATVPVQENVVIDIQAPEGVEILISVNGQRVLV